MQNYEAEPQIRQAGAELRQERLQNCLKATQMPGGHSIRYVR